MKCLERCPLHNDICGFYLQEDDNCYCAKYDKFVLGNCGGFERISNKRLNDFLEIFKNAQDICDKAIESGTEIFGMDLCEIESALAMACYCVEHIIGERENHEERKRKTCSRKED